jgi:PAS domain S-box-containing protein
MGDLDLQLKHLQAEVRSLRAFESAPYRAVVEDMTELVVRWRPDGTRVFVNDAYCRLFEAKREDLIGTSFWPLITEEDRAEVEQRIGRLSPEHPISTGRHRGIRANGDLVWMEWTDRALFDSEWRVVEYQSVGRDISERMRIEEQLRRIEQADAVAKASAAIAHDLSAIFQVLVLHFELEHLVHPGEDLDLARSAVHRGVNLLQQLKELRYKRLLLPIDFDLNVNICEALGLLSEVAGKHTRLETRLSPGRCAILGDPTQFDQILLNLVRNAAEATSNLVTIELVTESVASENLTLKHHWAGQAPANCRYCG